ncbi:MAG: 7-cyano-7-deazaguanine synthase, partial [Gammaproteobacteria bacterium]|nr:7-cyano-7-deazaguanine synthase [Gammaproteobacteria bacterium]
MVKAVILLSGGLDSATVLAIAREQGLECYTLSFDYGQRHRAELAAAVQVSQHLGAVEHRVMEIPIGALGGSALTDADIEIPDDGGEGIPVTYVPARNTVFLSLALAWAEVLA